MADADSAEWPLTAGAAGPHATEAFALLGNETRLAILLALWEEYDPHAKENAVPFSRIFDRVAYDDPGNLRYHLEKLEGQFVRQRAEREGYELRMPGLKLVRAVIAGAGVGDATLEWAGIEESCPCCGASTAVCYREGHVYWACTACEGPTPEETDVDGFLSAVPFEPAGLAGRTPDELRAASWATSRRQVRALFNGLCPACSGPVEAWLECCPDHDSGGCERCGRLFAAWATFQCRTCKNHGVTSPKALATFHPAVVAFYDDHGVSTRVRADDIKGVRRVFDLLDAHEMEVVSDEPPQVRVTATFDGDTVSLTFDETVRVVDVRQ